MLSPPVDLEFVVDVARRMWRVYAVVRAEAGRSSLPSADAICSSSFRAARLTSTLEADLLLILEDLLAAAQAHPLVRALEGRRLESYRSCRRRHRRNVGGVRRLAQLGRLL